MSPGVCLILTVCDISDLDGRMRSTECRSSCNVFIYSHFVAEEINVQMLAYVRFSFM